MLLFWSYTVCRSSWLPDPCFLKLFAVLCLYLKKIRKPCISPVLFLYQILMSAHFLTSVSTVLVITSLDFSDASVKWATSWTEVVVTAQVKIILNNRLFNFLLVSWSAS